MSCNHCTAVKEGKTDNFKDNKFLLIGSPNVGKSSFFTRVTWSSASVGNVDGITVKTQKGKLKNHKHIVLWDLPGIRDLTTTTKEEEIVIETLLSGQYDGVLNIASATTIKRDFILTLQLLEAGVLNEVIISMVDELQNQKINVLQLTKFLGVPINLLVIPKNIGVNQAIQTLLTSSSYKKPFKIDYGEKLEQVINEIEVLLPTIKVSKRFLAIQYLSKNQTIYELFKQWDLIAKVDAILDKHQMNLDLSKESIYFAKKNKIDLIVNHCFSESEIDLNKENAINLSNHICQNLINDNLKIVAKTNSYQGTENKRKLVKTKKIDKFLFHKWVAIPLFLILIAAVYYLCFGSYAGGWIVDQFTGAMELGAQKIGEAMLNAHASEWAAKFVEEGLFGGIITVLGFLPYILFLHICMSLLEQSGLLARISIILDKSFERYGLSGRSIITLMTGIGCSIPSILMARNSHSKKERFITVLIAPLVACSARIVVFNWIATAFVGNHLAWLMVLGLTVFSGLVALFIGWNFSNILFRSKQTFLLTELPPWRKPDFWVIIKSSLNEIWQFVKRIFTIIFVANIIMFLLTYIGPIAGAFVPSESLTNSLDPQNTSFLGYISYGLKYLAYPIGLGEDWRLFASIIASAPAKELAASNLELLFGNQENFHNAIFNSSITHLPISTIASYLVFFTFFTPCISTDIVIKKEIGRKYLMIELLTSFIVAYLLSAIIFNSFGLVEMLIVNPNLINYVAIIFSIIFFIGFVISNIVLITYYCVYKKQLKINDHKLNIIHNVWMGLNICWCCLFVITTTTAYGLYS